MATVAAAEELYQFIRIFSSDLRNLPFMRGFGDFFSNLFNHRFDFEHSERGIGLSSSEVENVVFPIDDSNDVNLQNLFLKQNGCNNNGGEHDPHVLFNVLDMVLVETMGRLKKLRESFSVLGRSSLEERFSSVFHSKFRFASKADRAYIRNLCLDSKVNIALDLYNHLISNHKILDIYTYNCLMNGLCKMGDLLSATQLLERMAAVGVSPNSVTYNTLIDEYCKSRNVDKAFDLASLMPQIGIKPDIYTYNSLMSGLCKMGNMLSAIQLLERMIALGVSPDSVTYNALVDGYCKSGNMDKALDLVSSMHQVGVNPNIVTYNTLIDGFCKSGNIDGAVYLLASMHQIGVKPNIVTCCILVRAFGLKGLQADMLPSELLEEFQNSPTVITSTILMDVCFKKGNVFGALQIWKNMFKKGVGVDRTAYNVLINGLCLIQHMKVACTYCSDMFKRGFLPDIVTLNTLISGFSRTACTNDACDMYNKIELYGLRPDNISYKLVIQALCRHGNIVEAVKLLHNMLENKLLPDRSIWNLILTAYGRIGDINAAFSIKNMMHEMGVTPNVYTYNALIHASLKTGNIPLARTTEKEMIQNEICPDAVTYNLFVSWIFNYGYLSHQCMEEAMKIHHIQPDIYTYTAWIRGLCKRRRMKEARFVFDKLLKSGLHLDHVPFQILIKTYCKRGQILEALDIYKRMTIRGLVGHFSLYRLIFIALQRSGYYIDAS